MRIVKFCMTIDHIPDGAVFIGRLDMVNTPPLSEEQKAKKIIDGEDTRESNILPIFMFLVTDDQYNELTMRGHFHKDVDQRSKEWAIAMGLPEKPIKP